MLDSSCVIWDEAVNLNIYLGFDLCFEFENIYSFCDLTVSKYFFYKRKWRNEKVWRKKNWTSHSILIIFERRKDQWDNRIFILWKWSSFEGNDMCACVCVLRYKRTELNCEWIRACVVAYVCVMPRLKYSEPSLLCITAGRLTMIYTYHHSTRSILSRFLVQHMWSPHCGPNLLHSFYIT